MNKIVHNQGTRLCMSSVLARIGNANQITKAKKLLTLDREKLIAMELRSNSSPEIKKTNNCSLSI